MPVSIGPVMALVIAMEDVFVIDGFTCAAAVTETGFAVAVYAGAVYEIGSPFGHAGTEVAVTAGTAGT